MKRVQNSVSHRPGAKRDSSQGIADRALLIVVLAFALWGIAQIVWHYPDSFFPRFADEAIYALDSRSPAMVFKEFDPERINYAPSKLGYGIPLAGSVALAGPDGPMYLSTMFWLATIVAVGYLSWRRLGAMTAVIAIAMLSYSSLFGKYVTDVGPTPEAAFTYVLFWGAACTRRSWLTGLAIGWLAFIDFKWALPAGFAYILVETFVETGNPFRTRMRRLAVATVTALSVVGAAAIIHAPYGKFLASYVTRHGDRVAFTPSPILIYYLFIFGAIAAVLVAVGAVTFPSVRREIAARERQTGHPVTNAICIFGVPAVFYSVFGDLKALRFFAVPYPLLAIAVAAALAATVRVLSDRLDTPDSAQPIRILKGAVLGLIIVAVLHGGGDGPAHQLTLPAGYPEVLARLRPISSDGDRISSYNWSILAYEWDKPGVEGSFAFLGLHDDDKWIVLDPIHDRATIGLRVRQSGGHTNPDSTWAAQRSVFESISDSLFSVRSDFYASDYFLSEIAADGISVFRRWRGGRGEANWMTVYTIDPVKLRTGWRR